MSITTNQIVSGNSGFTSSDVTSLQALVSEAGNVSALLALIKSTGYHFHGWAANQPNSDLKFSDYSGALNDASFQTHLTAANAWATAGFLTQADHTVASNLELVQIPALGWDFLNGDSLFFFWRGRATPEGTTQPLFGDTTGSSANGIRILCSSTGKLSFNLYQASGAVSRFGATSAVTVLEAATTHSFAICLDGATGKQCLWSDGVREAAFASGFVALSGGGAIDTLNAVPLKMGGDGSTSASVQNGVAMQTQALVILKGRRGSGAPAIADLDLLAANLHRNPQPLVSATVW